MPQGFNGKKIERGFGICCNFNIFIIYWVNWHGHCLILVVDTFILKRCPKELKPPDSRLLGFVGLGRKWMHN
jgi:hypothetical protein